MPSVSIWEPVVATLINGAADDRGSIHIFMPAPNVCVTRVVGHLSVNLARLIPMTLAEHFAADRRFSMLHDWEKMTSYDSGSRRLLTNWVLSNIGNIISKEFVLGSRLVAMGVSAANVATSLAGLELVAYPDRGTFEAALARSLYSAARRAAA